MNARRRALALLAGAACVTGGLLLAERGEALGPRAKLRLAQVIYSGGRAVPRSTALQRLAWELDKRTSVDVELEPATLRLSDRALFSHPLLYLSGDRAFEPFSEADVRRLARHLVFGGMLIVDSADSHPGGGFDRSVRRLLRRLFRKHTLAKIPRSHTVYQSFYLLSQFVGRVAAVPDLEGVKRDGRYLVVYSQNDLAGAWERDNFGQWEHGVHPGGEKQRELAFRWGINLVMYALCLDYKADQVHIPFILKRRRWQVGK